LCVIPFSYSLSSSLYPTHSIRADDGAAAL
jgi:hypothetical protein